MIIWQHKFKTSLDLESFWSKGNSIVIAQFLRSQAPYANKFKRIPLEYSELEIITCIGAEVLINLFTFCVDSLPAPFENFKGSVQKVRLYNKGVAYSFHFLSPNYCGTRMYSNQTLTQQFLHHLTDHKPHRC